MTTIADASTVDLNSPTTWAVLGALLVLAACVLIREAVNRSPVREPEPSRLDTLDGIGQCRLRCGLAGTVVRREHPSFGTETVYVCPGHSDEGDRRGWWAQ